MSDKTIWFTTQLHKPIESAWAQVTFEGRILLGFSTATDCCGDKITLSLPLAIEAHRALGEAIDRCAADRLEAEPIPDALVADVLDNPSAGEQQERAQAAGEGCNRHESADALVGEGAHTGYDDSDQS